jgi:hypothetical protein
MSEDRKLAENCLASQRSSRQSKCRKRRIKKKILGNESPSPQRPRLMDYERMRIAHCRKLALISRHPEEVVPPGYGLMDLESSSQQAFKGLLERILCGLKQPVHWSSYPNDTRQRGYCLLADSSRWSSPQSLTEEGIRFHDEGVPEELAEAVHKQVVANSFTTLILTEAELRAVEELICRTQTILNSFRNSLEVRHPAHVSVCSHCPLCALVLIRR